MEEFSAAGFAEYLRLIRSTIEEGQREGVFRADLNAKVVAKILFGALDEMATTGSYLRVVTSWRPWLIRSWISSSME
jgi:hypothetical protein